MKKPRKIKYIGQSLPAGAIVCVFHNLIRKRIKDMEYGIKTKKQKVYKEKILITNMNKLALFDELEIIFIGRKNK